MNNKDDYIYNLLTKATKQNKQGKKYLNKLQDKIKLSILIILLYNTTSHSQFITTAAQLLNATEESISNQLTWLTNRKYGLSLLKKNSLYKPKKKNNIEKKYTINEESTYTQMIYDLISDTVNYKDILTDNLEFSILFGFSNIEITNLIKDTTSNTQATREEKETIIDETINSGNKMDIESIESIIEEFKDKEKKGQKENTYTVFELMSMYGN